MKKLSAERRVFLRHNFRVPIRVRFWKSGLPEQRSESVNLSESGILFATDAQMPVGTVIEVLFKMPEAITGEPTTEWLCSGHVVRVEPIESPRGKLGVGMQFDCYQVSRTSARQTGGSETR